MPGDVKAARLLSLLLLLQARGRMSAPALARELEVSVRTVYRDVDALVAAGIPLWSEAGRAGGYRLVDGYRTRLTGMTAAEADALFLVGLPGPAAALGLTAEAVAAERKLLAALTPDQQERAGRLRDRFHLDAPAWYADVEDPPHLAALAEAVLHDRRVAVTYRRWEEPRDVARTLDPHGLVLKAGVWYVVARAHDPRSRRRPRPEDLRPYRASNVLTLEPTDVTFTRVAGFSLAARWQQHLADLDARRLVGTATVRVSAGLRDRLPDHPSHPLTAAIRAVDAPPGDVVVDLPVESIGRAAADLVVFGGAVEVLAPAELRAALAALAGEVAALYAEG
ncbi:YafY family protein [Iamia sp. SCSIO 61187]|uniref:helix-turn-helix transcriptional regulator n=1 Tax=Iamia sp. SCSIO 61187 TaxID=2722752 RepID=UPI001C629809|nr:WYL domain-containing protein [Iamia sp. SCSIO 61187]